MTRRLSFLIGALVCASSVNACWHDFSGYHLETDAGTGGVAGRSAAGGAGPSARSGGASGNADAETGAGEAGTTLDAGSSAGGDASAVGAAGSPADPSPITPPSCLDLPKTCGPDGNASCCAASTVEGGTYDRSNQPSAPATVSAFTLDEYEVTVGRFRNFVAAYSQSMTAFGSGKNIHDLGANPGWNSLWNARLPMSAAALVSAVGCPNATYTSALGANESKPMTCVSWYEAYAFCIWDGGRLPTEAEWNFAAVGGAEERPYPWGSPAPDDTRAVFCPGSCNQVRAVGTKAPSGNGKWGQADLVGNVWEWNLDVYANPYPKTACNDCANDPADSSDPRVFRGGSAGNDASFLLAGLRNSRAAGDHNGFVGVRCARNQN